MRIVRFSKKIAPYSAAQQEANLLPLQVWLLQRIGGPVLLHGTLEGGGLRMVSAAQPSQLKP